MAVPTVVGVGTVDSATPWAPTIAGTVLADDIIILVVEQIGNEAATVATGFAHVTGSPNNIDTTTRLNVLWKRAVGGETSVTVTGPVDHAVTRTITIRGCKTTGNPWTGTPATSQDTAVNATATWPAFTTTVADSLILFLIATGRDSAVANLGALSGGTGLTNVVEQMDNWVTTAGGGGIGLITATKAATGTTGSPTATMGSTDSKALMTLALEPAPAAAIPPSLVMAPRR